ncbi:MAG TPA: 50S ribosomal protein L29 [Bacteroidia bacterium]|jgi:large subunit ribosomal protein L29|nr:50S ribosomal protein L29 [Bacteroidia bacterium]
MKKEELTQLTLDGIREKIAEESASLSKLKLNHTVSSIENPLKIRSSRRLIARLKTELRSRELQSAKK